MQLPRLYNEVINHPNTSDEHRRETESKLLDHRQRYLAALPVGEEKTKVAAEVEEQINGMVLLKIPNELAWTLFIEAKDAENIGEYDHCEGKRRNLTLATEQYDFETLRQFVQLFPEAPRANLIRGYFGYTGVPLTNDSDDEEGGSPQQNGGSIDGYVDIIIVRTQPDGMTDHTETASGCLRDPTRLRHSTSSYDRGS